MIRLYLHLGYPKTGTTTLQRAFFDPLYREGRIHYLGMFGFANDATGDRKSFFKELTGALYLEDEKEFLAVLPGLRSAFWRLCEGVDGPVVLSNEHFVQSQWSTTVPGKRILPARTAARLSQVFEGVEVSLLLAVRRQDALLRSMYLELASRPNHANPEAYRSLSDYLTMCLDPMDFHGEFFDFDGVLGAFQNAFPKAPLLAWTFEGFRDRQGEVLRQISAFLGLGDGIPVCIPTPLAPQNVKSNGGAAVSPARWSLLHKTIYAMPGGKLLSNLAHRLPLMRMISNALKPRARVAALTAVEAESVLKRWAASNERLATRLPNLAAELRVGEYV